MAEDSKIQWTTHTMNPWRGCTKVSAGCANCYAETMSGRNPKVLGVWGKDGTRVVASEAQWRLPLKWDKAAALAGERHRVFCASLADVFEDWQAPMAAADGAALHVCAVCGQWRTMEKMCCGPTAHMPLTMDNVRQRLFDLIAATPHLDWLLLTKRPENIARMMWPGPTATDPVPLLGGGDYLPNVWLGTSVENQAAADARIPHLLRVPAAVRFLSCEPLLGPVDLTKLLYRGDYLNPLDTTNDLAAPHIDWCIIGGESGPGARPFNVEWARSLVRQCRAAGVKVFVKQLGANPQFQTADMHGPQLLTLRDRKGGDVDEFPEDLRVREFPR